MQFTDLRSVLEIERRTYGQPWPLDLFCTQLAREGGICLVCRCEGQVAGYLVADRFIDVWHLMNLCVDRQFRRRHLAVRLMEAYFAITEQYAHRGHALEVRASNHAAQTLYRRLGFVTTGRRPCYYSDNQEDAISMWRDWEGESA